jgi:hypothetical protein
MFMRITYAKFLSDYKEHQRKERNKARRGKKRKTRHSSGKFSMPRLKL